MKLSVIITTYNRANLLDLSLKSIVDQSVDSSQYEILVIDNNSSDETANVVNSYIQEHEHVRYILEERQGVSFARNRGAKEAKAVHIAYLDDDAQAAPDWVEKGLAVMNTYDPDVLGGPIYPYYLDEKPSWFKDDYEIRLHHKEPGWLSDNTSLSASNLWMNKESFDAVGGFNPAIGPIGTKFTYGDENELINRMVSNGARIYYSHDLKVTHHVPAFKMNIAYQMFQSFENPRSHFEMNDKFEKLPLETISDELVGEMGKVLNVLTTNNEHNRGDGIPTSFEELFMTQLSKHFFHMSFLAKQYEENKKRHNNLRSRLATFSIEKFVFMFNSWIKK